MKLGYHALVLGLTALSLAGKNPFTPGETLLHRLSGGTGGAYVYARLIADGKRALYGTTYEGDL